MGDDIGVGDCNWAVIKENVEMCFGAPNEQTLQNTKLEFQCVKSCGGLVSSAIASNTNTQTIPGPWPVGTNTATGSKFSCGGGNLSTDITKATRWQIDVGSLGCGMLGVVGISVGVALPAGAIISTLVSGGLGTTGTTLTPACLTAINNFRPVIEGRVVQNGVTICRAPLELSVNAQNVVTSTGGPIPSDVVLDPGNPTYTIQPCSTGLYTSTRIDGLQGKEISGIRTDIGCIPAYRVSFFKNFGNCYRNCGWNSLFIDYFGRNENSHEYRQP